MPEMRGSEQEKRLAVIQVPGIPRGLRVQVGPGLELQHEFSTHRTELEKVERRQ